MCGITGIVTWTEAAQKHLSILEKMQAALRHRGPDQADTALFPHCLLAHDRLAVIDVECGRQPMSASTLEETFTIVYNGELYNTPELRSALQKEGTVFQTHCDTEVILQAYLHWGSRCVEQLNGIFAFAIWEHKKERLFLARDRMGVKPLFYAETPDGILFASEIKALLQHPDVPHKINANGIAHLLLLGPGRKSGCGVFETIKEVKRACCGYADRTGISLAPYWELHAKPHTETIEQTIEHVRYLVTDAVKRQLVSDVPLGTFLSGGLDSSLLSSIASREQKRLGIPLHTFSVDYKDNDRYFQKSHFQPNSDPEYIRCMMDYLQCHHHWTVLDTPQLVEALLPAMTARDLPGMADVDSSLYLFCKDIRQTVTVALSGECADELFGGYPWYRDEHIREREEFPWARSTDYRMQFLRPELAAEIDGNAFMQAAYQETVDKAELLPEDSALERRMRQMMMLNVDWFMQTLLDRKDRMSMAHSLEVRVPFCDYRIAEYLYNVPWEMKEYRGYEKGLLRAAMEDYLPEKVLWRKKSPYPKTHNPNYTEAMRQILGELLKLPELPLLRLVSREQLVQLYETPSKVQWYGQLMTYPQTIAYLLQLNAWLEQYQVTW